MDRLEQIESAILALLHRYKSVRTGSSDKYYVIHDKESQHFLLYHIGWNKETRIHHCIIHIRAWMKNAFLPSQVSRIDVSVQKIREIFFNRRRAIGGSLAFRRK
ncbi:MAG: XisI protein [Leptospiraceae bacterium]|nr:XisI protein [Leptospiraceae bacterium]MCP5500118.1 XisI protein [Leptospiraceae bacterium]